jgi:predicted ATPase
MRLSWIEIENFKGIGKRQTINLKPITLLFGPNSAGKSTLLQALHYFREILERQNPDPDQTIAGGLMDLGGFKQLVHRHDLNRAIKIKLVVDLHDEFGSEHLPLGSGILWPIPDYEHLPIRYLKMGNTARSVAVELAVQWSESRQSAYVSQTTIDIDGHTVANVSSPPQKGRALLSGFNLKHPLFEEVLDEDDPHENDVLVNDNGDFQEETDPMAHPLGAALIEMSRELATNTLELRGVDIRVGVDTRHFALPDMDDGLKIELMHEDGPFSSPEEIRATYEGLSANYNDLAAAQEETARREYLADLGRREGLRKLLDELIVGPMFILKEYLAEMRYLGPLRDVPPRNFQPKISPDEARWANGLAAWDLLYDKSSGQVCDDVNAWMAGEDWLNMGYELQRLEFREIPVPSRLSVIFERGLSDDDIGEVQSLYENLDTRSEILLRDTNSGVLLTPSDVGVGISQVLPVITACVAVDKGLLAIEQPELHIHPAVQVGLGDLFISAATFGVLDHGGASLLIETHSEHILLRLLRRIREFAADELPPNGMALTPHELSVIYVEPSDEGVRFKALRIDDEGEFIDRWPKGFFEERGKELF